MPKETNNKKKKALALRKKPRSEVGVKGTNKKPAATSNSTAGRIKKPSTAKEPKFDKNGRELPKRKATHGTAALREMMKLQSSKHGKQLLLAQQPFVRVVRSVARKAVPRELGEFGRVTVVNKGGKRSTASLADNWRLGEGVAEAIQKMTEAHVSQILQGGATFVVAAGRQTLFSKDVVNAREVMGERQSVARNTLEEALLNANIHGYKAAGR